MLLAIDIGNTNINFGIFDGRRLVKRAVIATKEKNYLLRLKKLCARHKIKDALVCSVVPQAQRRMASCLKQFLGKGPYIIGKDIKVPIKNRYRVPAQVGQDRLVNAYAAAAFYGVPAIVVDSGTAVTMDVISASGAYLGGLILPGLQLSLDALAERTALLPKVKLSGPEEFIGRDTKNSILSGVVCGLAAAVDELCGRIRDIIGTRALVIGTGGGIGMIGKFCRQIKRYDKDLTLKGINLIYNYCHCEEYRRFLSGRLLRPSLRGRPEGTTEAISVLTGSQQAAQSPKNRDCFGTSCLAMTWETSL